jgi:hypothetical protein
MGRRRLSRVYPFAPPCRGNTIHVQEDRWRRVERWLVTLVNYVPDFLINILKQLDIAPPRRMQTIQTTP